MRHGFDADYNSENFLNLLANTFYIYFDDKRQNTNGNPITPEMKQSPKYFKNYQPIPDWKAMKERQKTISAVLVLCLNLGVDPPDIMKTYPCAKLESWCDPSSFPDTKKAIENIGKNLQSQYETLSLRTRYKQSLDPCVEDVKRFCNTLRRNAKDERILFHYNGHGVPQPTSSGEIWVFNRGYTQYIPISLYDLQTWLGAPVIFVYDCNSAGNIVHNFKKFVQKRIDDDNEGNHDASAPSPTSAYLDCIQLAACKSNELLPMSPDLPADLFTCCLTCPIDISIKWFIMQSPLKKNYYSLLPKNSVGNVIIPGKLTDRRTPLGELNWIFTAITDTIAWTSLSRPIFKRLFRQDLMVAALFRNFLLAKRIMPHLNCNPISDPPLPDLVRFHPMWDSWDLAIDQVFSQLIKNNDLDKTEPSLPPIVTPQPTLQGSASNGNLIKAGSVSAPSIPGTPSNQNLTNYQHSTFFEQQLTAFEIWLKYAGPSTKEPPEQLPIVLQVLLSQVHRLRALILLSKFLDLGPWAVYLSLSIGIFPYVLKLLQSPAQELKPVLIFIWARIMAIDYKSTQQELCKDKGYNYFYLILNSNPINQIGAPGAPGSFSSNGVNAGSFLVNDDHKAMSAFILTLFIKDFKNGQRLCFSIEIINNCLKFIQTSENPLLRQWCSLLLSQLWNKYPDGKWIIYKDGYLNKLLTLINDPIPEVRTSIIVAITNFLSDDIAGQPQMPQQNASSDLRKDEVRQQDLKLANTILGLLGDGSSMVRKEIVFFINRFVTIYFKFFLVVAFNQLEEEIVLIDNSNYLNDFRKRSPAYGSIFSSIWKSLLILSEDPHSEVKQLAETLIDSVMVKLNESELGPLVKEMQDYLLSKSTINISESFKPTKPIVNRQLGQKRQISSASMVNRKNNMLTINGSSITTRSASTNNLNRSAHDDSASDTESITSKIKNLSLARIFKTFQMTEESDIKNFSRILNSGPVQTNYGAEYRPKTPFYKPRDLSKLPELPPVSGFFEYSCEYFQEPQMSKNEIDEPGSKEYVKRLWRRNRNESIIQETQPQKELAIRGDWNKNLKTLNNKSQPKFIKFTQFEKVLVASDEKDNVSVWDWEENKIIKKFSNGNPFGTKITDMKFLNEDDLPLLLAGSSDGVIKIYKNFHNYEDDSDSDNENKIELVASWRALTDLLLTSKSSGLISEWQQSRGSLLVSGDVKIIRVWDAPRELCLVDIPARSSSSITSLTSDQVAGNIFIGGFDDGSLRVYDRRLDSRESMVKTWRANRNSTQSKSIGFGSIRNVHMQRGGFRELVSGSSDGYVNIWDIRLDDPVLTFNASEKSMRCIDTHEHAPIITTGSKSVNLWTTSGDLISTLKNPHDNYLTNRTSSYLSSTTFHPHRMTIATNYNQDGHINVYTCSDTMVEY
ncbi:Kontroller of growth [Scheffersomyces xylosifermentans]|uniref:Kontroller of growth n=1 Tax=Scheffersomyces xylosifermentans TaxID=1304137 RepID=UPI00315DD816